MIILTKFCILVIKSVMLIDSKILLYQVTNLAMKSFIFNPSTILLPNIANLLIKSVMFRVSVIVLAANPLNLANKSVILKLSNNLYTN